MDHRLKLYLDMEVFEDNNEEFQCFLKVSSCSTNPTALLLGCPRYPARSARGWHLETGV